MNNNYILALDVSTTTIGIALFEDMGVRGKLKLLHHVSPVVKPKVISKMEELFKKVNIFEEELFFLVKSPEINITRVIIEEPLLQSNNVYTVGTLLRFNGMVAKLIYEKLNIVPDFISSYDARKYAFPELMQVRKFKKDGTPVSEKQISKSEPVLFGAYSFKVDKKLVIWEKVSELEPQIEWLYDKNFKIKKESFDMTDAYTAGIGFMNKINLWKK